MWVFDYLEKEWGVAIYREPVQREINGKRFFIGHGDGLGPGDRRYKVLKKVFRNPLCQWLFERIHPNLGMWMAFKWSNNSREKTEELRYLGDDREHLMQFCVETLKTEHYDYFIFGHRHLPFDKEAGPTSRYINLGDWIINFSYAVFDGEKVELKYFGK